MYGFNFRILAANDRKPAAVCRCDADPWRHLGKRLDGCAKCHRNLRCNKVYASQGSDLTMNCTDALATVSWRDILNCLEACTDACEHVSECVGSVIMKNT